MGNTVYIPVKVLYTKNCQEKHSNDGEEFDYVVVGAGAAGTAAAARLAMAGRKVLLVEAGGQPGLLSKIPAAAMGLLRSPIDWQYDTIPNNVSCLSSQGRQCRFSRGKCLGGSTAINYMMYVRGHRSDYNLNITGWTWNELQPYFLRYEGLQDLDLLPFSSKLYHNVSGIMRIGFFDDPKNPWHTYIQAGLRSLNFPFNADVNAETLIGVSQMIGYVYKGERMTTARAYLAKEVIGDELKVATDTRCIKVIFDENNEAVGVRLSRNKNDSLRIKAKEEVILSAGAIGTPQILMLSGIGPAEHLDNLGICVRSDLPVGNDMSDHVLPLIFILVDKNLLSLGVDLVKVAAEALQWTTFRNGTFASDGLIDITAFVNTRCYDFDKKQLVNNDTDCDLPTLQLINAYIDRGLIISGKPIFKQSSALNDNIVQQLSAANAFSAMIVVSPVVLNPHSRGTVRLANRDPLQDPEIFPNYLSDERDVEEMIRSITILEHLVETPVYKKHGASILHLKLEGCPSYEEDRERYWRCYVRHMTSSVYHAVGTAALGEVLDAQMRVRGVQRLRIADLSVLPKIPLGNTAAAAIALGERVVDFILHGSK